jgi:hypothetical protein
MSAPRPSRKAWRVARKTIGSPSSAIKEIGLSSLFQGRIASVKARPMISIAIPDWFHLPFLRPT